MVEVIECIDQSIATVSTGWSRWLEPDISLMIFFTRTWEECDWQSGDSWTASCRESSRPCKHKNVNGTWKARGAASCWCHLAPLGSAGLYGSLFCGFWRSLSCLLILTFLCAVEAEWLSKMLSITVVCHHTEQSLMPGGFFPFALTHARMNQ